MKLTKKVSLKAHCHSWTMELKVKATPYWYQTTSFNQEYRFECLPELEKYKETVISSVDSGNKDK